MEEFQSLNYKFMDVKSCSLREEEDENYEGLLLYTIFDFPRVSLMRDTGRRTCFIKFVHALRMYRDIYTHIYTRYVAEYSKRVYK